MIVMNTAAEDEPDLKHLFRWQEEAIEKWEAADHRGIIEAMTGTGKTIVAVKAIRKLVQSGQKVSPLIVVPSIALLNQWYEVLRLQFPSERFGRIGDGWNDDFSRCSTGALPLACIGTVHSSVGAVEGGLFDHCKNGATRSMLVADECHRYLNEDQKLFNRILRFPYDYTMGLSATIERFEVPGLGKIVHTFAINEAVKQGVIPPFDILNVGVSLNQIELREYLELSDCMADMIKHIKTAYPELEGSEGELFWRMIKRLAEEESLPLARSLLGVVFKRSAIAYTAVAKLELVPEMIRIMVSKAHRKLLVFFERIWTAEQGQDDIVRKTAESIRRSLASAGVNSGYDPIWCKLFHSQLNDSERNAALE